VGRRPSRPLVRALRVPGFPAPRLGPNATGREESQTVVDKSPPGGACSIALVARRQRAGGQDESGLSATTYCHGASCPSLGVERVLPERHILDGDTFSGGMGRMVGVDLHAWPRRQTPIDARLPPSSPRRTRPRRRPRSPRRRVCGSRCRAARGRPVGRPRARRCRLPMHARRARGGGGCRPPSR
jgi:hypothetical protein